MSFAAVKKLFKIALYGFCADFLSIVLLVFSIIYGEKGYPLEFLRMEYKYCNVSMGQWKASKKTFEQFEKLGMKWFVK